METRIVTRDEMLKALDILKNSFGKKAKQACLEITFIEDGKRIKLYCNDFKSSGNEDTVASEVVGS